MVALLSMAGLLIAVAIYEIDTGGFAGKNFEQLDYTEFPNAMDHPRNNYWFTNPARMVIAISSGMAIFFLGLRHYYKKQWLNEFFIDDDPNNQKEPDLFK